MKVAIFGASGLTGATLVERLIARGDCEVVACIHSSGNAWRLARMGIALTQVDLLDEAAVKDVISTCTHVVNCARGDEATMFTGLKHMLEASRAAKVKQFVHLSSVMVYGDPPVAASVDEAASAEPVEGTYGWIKLKQDEMVEAAARAGLRATVLCPPNISGPYSHYVQTLIGSINGASLAIVDGGGAPCLLADVRNLCHAIELALERGPSDGKRLFVSDGTALTWAQLLAELEPVVAEGALDRLARIGRAELAPLLQQAPPARASLKRSLKHLVSSEVRAAMRLDPMWGKLDGVMRQSVAKMGRGMEDKLRLSIEGTTKVRRKSRYDGLDLRLSGHQLRDTVHSNRRVTDVLGYHPLVTPQESMAAFRRWYRKHQGMDDAFSDLTARLA